MEIRVLDDRSNPLLKRHEVAFEVTHATQATPSREAVRGELSKLVHAPKDRVIIEHMRARYGTSVTRGEALVYESVDVAKATEREHILVRNGLKEKAAKGPAAPAEAPKAEIPKDEAAKPVAPKAESAPSGAPPVEHPKAEARKGKAAKDEAGKAEPGAPAKKE